MFTIATLSAGQVKKKPWEEHIPWLKSLHVIIYFRTTTNRGPWLSSRLLACNKPVHSLGKPGNLSGSGFLLVCSFHCSPVNYRNGGSQCFLGLFCRVFFYSSIDLLDRSFDLGPVCPVAFPAYQALPVSFQCGLMICQLNFLLNFNITKYFISLRCCNWSKFITDKKRNRLYSRISSECQAAIGKSFKKLSTDSFFSED